MTKTGCIFNKNVIVQKHTDRVKKKIKYYKNQIQRYSQSLKLLTKAI